MGDMAEYSMSDHPEDIAEGQEQTDLEFLAMLNRDYGGWDTHWESLDDVPEEVLKQAGSDIDNLIQGLLGA